MTVETRKGMPSTMLDRQTFEQRLRARFYDPAFATVEAAIESLVPIAWKAYEDDRKAPRTRRAGPGFDDPDYELSVEWLAARDAIGAAEHRQKSPDSPSRILLINASPRSDQTCPGEISKSWRLVQVAQSVFREQPGVEVDLLDLSRVVAERSLHIHPCKACVSTAMPLCHWPCSCYPNHAYAQVNDWMHEIYPLWVAAHGIMIVTPVHWYQAPTVLKAMIDRLVCADGGNPDPTSTSGKDPDKAKALELQGWSFPRHLAGRTFAIVVHGDAAGAENLRRILSDWLGDMGLIGAGHRAEIDRYIGYYESYAASHDALDADRAVQQETRNAARALLDAVQRLRRGELVEPGQSIDEPRPK